MPLMKVPNHLRLIVAIPPWAIRSRRAVLIDHGAVGVMIPRCRYLRSACSPCRASNCRELLVADVTRPADVGAVDGEARGEVGLVQQPGAALLVLDGEAL